MQKASELYREALTILTQKKFNFLIGGAYALRFYTGITRDTKDLDIFCKPGDYVEILKELKHNGFKIEVTDARWIVKAFKNDFFIDFIFSTVNNLCTVDNSWFEHAVEGDFLGMQLKYLAPEELFCCKIYVLNRDHYDGADLNHLILKKGLDMDWKRVIDKLDQHWQLVLSQFLNFQFIYPSERDIIPKWLFDNLIKKAIDQYEVPPSFERICLGPMVEHTEYNVDSIEWNYKVFTVKKL
jgi:hypothetical protein